MVTKNGVATAVCTITLLAGGILADYPELVMFGLAGVAAFLVAAIWVVARPRLTAVRDIRPRRVVEGDPARGVLTVTNAGSRRSPPLVAIETIAGVEVRVPLPSLAARSSDQVEYPLPPAGRGRHVIPALTIGHADPFRLLHIGRSCGGESVLYVHPRVHRVAPVPLGGPRDVEGRTSSRSVQGGAAFHSLREYEPGDDWRLIDWKSTARTGTLVVRHNVVPDEPRQLIFLDTSAGPYGRGSFDEAVRIAASFCVAASRSGFPVALRTTGDLVDGDDQAIQWHDTATAPLDQLSVVRCSAADRGLSALVDIVRVVVAHGDQAAIAIVTGQVTAGHLELMAALRPRFLTAGLVQVSDESAKVVVPPRELIAVRASSCARFAMAWNKLVPQ
ncbi:hypothetical protein ALI144C_08005 [Actinosynnema sp. ALI-1.44]|uniref:DUF58 domain-containing protein n=1 Tax=Actinosynnema sp. ALI-1.44 TaxID=1933779 RepID=UPI00097BF2F1|nr:DUF58 domain-containing protein [Actinosynnema sp. ALI-1.44]ONI87958.1 hypothetical protein ALI144C_08005 [Actinosynnema sp. ALI-1.44]